MSNPAEAKINELERELALRKGYFNVKVIVPKGIPADVAKEIESRLYSAAHALAQGSELQAPSTLPFTEEEIATLKIFAQVAKNKTVPAQDQAVAPISASSVPTPPARTGSIHVPTPGGSPRKARIISSENIRGEARKYAAAEDEVFVANPEKIDEHGMVSATHMKRGAMLKIPVDDLDFID